MGWAAAARRRGRGVSCLCGWMACEASRQCCDVSRRTPSTSVFRVGCAEMVGVAGMLLLWAPLRWAARFGICVGRRRVGAVAGGAAVGAEQWMCRGREPRRSEAASRCRWAAPAGSGVETGGPPSREGRVVGEEAVGACCERLSLSGRRCIALWRACSSQSEAMAVNVGIHASVVAGAVRQECVGDDAGSWA